MHKYGAALRFTDLTAGRVLWQTAPTADASGEVVGFPTKTFWWRFGIPVEPTHTYRLTAVYDNPTGEPIPDAAMGALGGVFVPDDMSRWPAVDRSSAEYQRDVQVTYDNSMSNMRDMDMDDMKGETSGGREGVREGMLTGTAPTGRTVQTP